MTQKDIVAAFKSAQLAGVPPLASFVDPKERIFWILWVGKELVGKDMMTPAEVSLVLRDCFGVVIPRQAVQAVLSKERETVARRKREGRLYYQIMQSGVELVVRAAPTILFIEPAAALTKIREIDRVLADLKGTLRICDPYVDPQTLVYLAQCGSAKELRLLTTNVSQMAQFKRDTGAFVTQYKKSLEVRVAAKGVLHDRYVIHDSGMLSVGTSFNGLGRKQSLVVTLGEDIRSIVLVAFDSAWLNAAPL